MQSAPPNMPPGMAEKIVTLWVAFYVIFTVLTLLAVIVFDAWAIWHKQPSVTHTLRKLAHDEPMLVAAWVSAHALLVGHLFWSR